MSQLPKHLNRRRPLYAAVMTGTMTATGLMAITLSGCDSKPTTTVEEAVNPTAAKKEVAALANPCNPCAAKACNPCAAKACNPCAATACNPCNPCAAKACNPCNPCAAKACNPCNPCAANACNPCNPCAAKACNPCNPCAAKACNPCNPCAAKACNPCNPCAANACNPCNPCAAGGIKASDFMRPEGVDFDPTAAMAMAEKGKDLWNDTTLSSNGLSCNSCHNGGALLNATFAKPYPHEVNMPTQQAGVGEVDIDEMVNFCMVAPMQAKPLAWNSDELLALSAYSLELQASFNPCAANPCAAKNPCNPCNPCAATNPCNPCAAKNPCNPCAAKNPCNPCNPCAAK